MQMNTEQAKLQDFLKATNDEFGGDITFLEPTKLSAVQTFERKIGWALPSIYRFLLTNECNGLRIGNRTVLGVLESGRKKTLSDNLERNNDPATSFWFKGRPHIFKDYLVIATDGEICFCYSKKYKIDNPLIYICENANYKLGVDFERLELDLQGLIEQMIANEFGSRPD